MNLAAVKENDCFLILLVLPFEEFDFTSFLLKLVPHSKSGLLANRLMSSEVFTESHWLTYLLVQLKFS